MPTEEHVEYMVLPRLTALAEVVWSPQEARDFDDFADRLARSFWRFDSLGLTYASHLLDVDHIVGPADHGAILMLTSIDKESIIRYTTDGSEPTSASTIYQTPFPLMKDMPIRAARFKGRRRSKNILSFGFMMHKAVGKPIGLDALPHPTFGYRGRGALVNGILGNGERFADGEWLGWYRWNMDAVIDLLGETSVDSVSIRIFCSVPEWLWLPRKVEVSASDNGKDFTPVAEFSAFDYAATQRVVRVTLPLHGLRTEYLRVFVPNYGIIPDGSPGAGNYTWLFVDEIVVK
jgi:hexosaminidase